MPQERPNHYGHLLAKRSDDEWREIAARQRYASPHFPTKAEATRRRRHKLLRVGAVYLSLFGVASSMALSSVLTVSFIGVIGTAVVAASAAVFFGYEYFTRERLAP